jgi:hypothetical protein
LQGRNDGVGESSVAFAAFAVFFEFLPKILLRSFDRCFHLRLVPFMRDKSGTATTSMSSLLPISVISKLQ